MPRPLLIDANNLIVRNVMATALQDLQHGGKFTGGIYGALRTLKALVSTPEWHVGRVYAFFDNGVPRERRKLLPGYKGERAKRRELMPEEEKERAFQQVDDCFDLFPLLGITCVCFKDREADDGIAAAARLLCDHQPIIVSGDHDLWQCVTSDCELWDLGESRLIDLASFQDLVGVPHELFLVYKALLGDSSDSIEGVKGCGPKRAAQLVEALVEQFPKVLGKRPLQQLDDLALHLAMLPKRRQFEEAALLAAGRLQSVIRGIDLSDSWGGTRGLSGALDAPSKLDSRGFLRAARDLGMKSILGDPEGWLGPFRAAQARVSRKYSAPV